LCTAGVGRSSEEVDVLVDRLRTVGIQALCSDGMDPSLEGQILMAHQVNARFIVEISRDCDSFKLTDRLIESNSKNNKKTTFKDMELLMSFIQKKIH